MKDDIINILYEDEEGSFNISNSDFPGLYVLTGPEDPDSQ